MAARRVSSELRKMVVVVVVVVQWYLHRLRMIEKFSVELDLLVDCHTKYVRYLCHDKIL